MAYANEVKLFGKWSYDEIEVSARSWSARAVPARRGRLERGRRGGRTFCSRCELDRLSSSLPLRGPLPTLLLSSRARGSRANCRGGGVPGAGSGESARIFSFARARGAPPASRVSSEECKTPDETFSPVFRTRRSTTWLWRTTSRSSQRSPSTFHTPGADTRPSVSGRPSAQSPRDLLALS